MSYPPVTGTAQRGSQDPRGSTHRGPPTPGPKWTPAPRDLGEPDVTGDYRGRAPRTRRAIRQVTGGKGNMQVPRASSQHRVNEAVVVSV